MNQGIEALGFTLSSFARACGVKHYTICQIRTGERPGRKHWPKIAEVLGCTVEWLVQGTGTAPTWHDAPVIPKTMRVLEHQLKHEANDQVSRLESIESKLDQVLALLARNTPDPIPNEPAFRFNPPKVPVHK